MAGLRQGANIFTVVKTMKDAWASIEGFDTSGFSEEELAKWIREQNRFRFEGSDVRQTLVSEFEDFVFSCEWTDSAVVRDIVGYVKSGVRLTDIGNLVGLKKSAFSMRIIRLTRHINDLLFDGQSCQEGTYSLTDLGAIKKCLVKIRLVRDPISINEEFSLRQLGWIKAHIEGVGEVKIGRENLDKYLKVILFLGLTSRTFTLNLLDDIDPGVLSYALKDMQSDAVNSTKLLFSLLLKHLTSDSVACKDELAMVKREYQDYMRG